MKKIVMYSLFLLLAQGAWATHIRGGYLDYKWIEGYTFEFTAHIYLDVSGVLAEPTVSISGLPELSTLPFFEYVSLPGDAGKETRKGVYKGRYTFPNVPYLGVVTYKVGVKIMNRNRGIINMAPPSDATPFYIESEIQIGDYLAVNNSPVFTDGLPVILAKTNEISIAEIIATDSDGDSLVYSITPTLESKDRIVAGYVSPDKVPPCTTCSINIDSDTGKITWNKPVRAGEYVITVKVEEYRRIPNTNNYLRIGYITRDMQVIVQD